MLPLKRVDLGVSLHAVRSPMKMKKILGKRFMSQARIRADLRFGFPRSDLKA
jgi:hypothetical protein